MILIGRLSIELKKMEEGTILFFISALIAEIIGTMAGFGSSTIFLPLALLFVVDFKTAIILVAIFHLFGNLSRIIFFRQGFDKRIILQFGVPSILLSLVGALLIGVLPQPVLKLVLGIFLITTSASFHIGVTSAIFDTVTVKGDYHPFFLPTEIVPFFVNSIYILQ